MKVRFIASAEMRDAAGKVVFSASPGDIKDLAQDQARRWLRRGKATTELKPQPAAAEPPPVQDEPEVFGKKKHEVEP